MKNGFIRWGLALSLLALRPAAAADYLSDFSQFPAFAYNTAGFMQGGAYVGCGPTTGAMMLAYFQSRHALSGLLTNPGTGADAGLNTAWALHGSSYMKTGSNGFGDVLYIEPGLEQYAADQGFTLKVTIHAGPWYADPASADAAWLNAYGSFGDAWTNDAAFWVRNPNGTWTIDAGLFCDFMTTRLQQGTPIFLTIDTNADGGGDHWVPLVGVDRAAGRYAYYNTYDTALHWADIYYMGDPAGKRANSISMVRTVELMLAEPDIAVDWTEWNFGALPVGADPPVHYLTVTNEGGAPLSVSQVSLTASLSDFTVLNGDPFVLMPGNGRQIGVRFNPESTGVKRAFLVLTSNDPDENPLMVQLTGTSAGSGDLIPLMISLDSGMVNDLAAVGDTLFAATEAGGVFRSDDHGNTWNQVRSGLTNTTVRCLLADGTRLYAGTWGGGVFCTDDDGGLWTPISSGMTNLYVTSLAIDPPGVEGTQRLLAGTWGGVFYSGSHGLSWNDVSAGLTETHVRSVLCAGAHFFAGTINGLFRSADLGQSWVPVHNGLTNTAVICLERRAGNLYAGTDGGGVYLSEDDGDAWIPRILNGSDFVIPDLASFGTDLFAATWGKGAYTCAELAPFCVPMVTLTETNIRSLAAACMDPVEGQWCILAGTEAGNVWFLPVEGSYPIVVDGEKDVFYEGLSGPEDGFLQIRSYAWNDVGAPSGDDDLSARVWAAWDEQWLYLYEEVTDDVLSGNGVNVYDNDCIEVKIDPQPADSTVVSVWDTRLTALDDATAGTVSWDEMTAVTPNAFRQWQRRTIPGGYALELAVDWRAITSNGETISPAVGVEFGMSINQHDNDGEGRMVAAVLWAAVLKEAVWNTPKFLGTARLLPDHKVRFIARNSMTGTENPVPYDGSEYTRSAVADEAVVPAAFGLLPNYPNPFNPSTTVSFCLPRASVARVAVFDIRGRQVAVLADGRLEAGVHRVAFDGSGLAGGVYILRLETESGTAIRKMAMVK